jgi:hypothetical protein
MSVQDLDDIEPSGMGSVPVEGHDTATAGPGVGRVEAGLGQSGRSASRALLGRSCRYRGARS